MKFLEYTPLARVNAFLSNVNLGDCHIQGALEAYSCKLAGMDKKLSRSLEQEVLDSLHFSSSLSTSPVGPLSSTASRRTLIYLILTLNHMFPDYNFSMLRAHHFSKEHGLSAPKQKIEHFLLEASKVWATEVGEETSLMDCLWSAVGEVMDLADCDVYTCVPDFEGDPFADRGCIWSFNYFFYNKKLKRILCFSCRCLSKMSLDQGSDEDVSEEEYEFIEGMDLED
ncbi:repressor of RNA polymerase III transcription MAF1 [Marchantia polymorpha subsp. ruderalis]|uniref:Repressor of RNA polymerase III transcription n=1 Tax=Marchantia polymorpha TaxID=3197 RepID=A0A2R6XJJ0_MARPO|nr:hypothetical protein MARPO_0012s0169 [Marchantia polymorpha]BBN18595.1 hypothetical protein Mp_8g03790 [Marchantia polymorpha subsp. ruderalis]|eukprot:PTQ46242.1 hypothetical protein MARPO_0012s0169 [Marchantia polymorpha]